MEPLINPSQMHPFGVPSPAALVQESTKRPRQWKCFFHEHSQQKPECQTRLSGESHGTDVTTLRAVGPLPRANPNKCHSLVLNEERPGNGRNSSAPFRLARIVVTHFSGCTIRLQAFINPSEALCEPRASSRGAQGAPVAAPRRERLENEA